MIRNYLCINIAGSIMEYAPRVRFCEVFLDDSYQGVYVMMEKIAYGEDRINISKSNSRNPFTSYIIRLDRGDKPATDIPTFMDYSLMRWTQEYSGINIEYPGTNSLNDEWRSYIAKDFSKFEKALYSYDYDDDIWGYDHFIDTDSFVDYFIINEFFQNYDAGRFSTYLYKDVRGKIHIGPVWDFNNACNNYMEIEYSTSEFELQDHIWYDMLIRDEVFVERVIRRYEELRQTVLSDAYLQQYIDETATFLGDAVLRNYEIWGYSFDASVLETYNRLDPVERNYSSYEEALEQLKNFINDRGIWMDAHIDILRQYAHESRVKNYNH